MTPPEPPPLFELHGAPVLHDPVLVVALEGWVDAGLGAASAMASLTDDPPAAAVATFDVDHFLDQRARRPVARIVDGVTTDLSWPTITLRHGHDRSGADVLFLMGPEPDFHWAEFGDAVVRLAVNYDVRMVVGLGAFPAPAPHTRPVKLAATAPPASADLVARVGVVQGELEVPAGIQSTLELRFGALAIPTVSLWARVPHYVSAMPFPEASAALVEGLAAIAGLTLDASALRTAADRSRRQVDELIAGNPEHLAMVRKLEASIDASEGNPLGVQEVPSADEIAAELEQFLRGEEGT
ncbi:MAG TPA: PAC2 family protein [Acidimicrobiales bacterium]|nr:PAC2 family protein [Acidimicrobiales bacterium]